MCHSSMDTYGYIYDGSFNPAVPTNNLLALDDNSGGNYQFLFGNVFPSLANWILVVTTFSPNVTGAFSITATGPAFLNFSRINASGKESNYLKVDLESNESLIDIRIY